MHIKIKEIQPRLKRVTHPYVHVGHHISDKRHIDHSDWGGAGEDYTARVKVCKPNSLRRPYRGCNRDYRPRRTHTSMGRICH